MKRPLSLDRDEARVRKALERYVFFLGQHPDGIPLAVFVAAQSFQSCDATDIDRMAMLERYWPLLGVYRRGATADDMLDDWRAFVAEAKR